MDTDAFADTILFYQGNHLIIPLDGLLCEEFEFPHPAILILAAHPAGRVAVGQVTLAAVQ